VDAGDNDDVDVERDDDADDKVDSRDDAAIAASTALT
jgi:hypothetical protein